MFIYQLKVLYKNMRFAWKMITFFKLHAIISKDSCTMVGVSLQSVFYDGIVRLISCHSEPVLNYNVSLLANQDLELAEFGSCYLSCYLSFIETSTSNTSSQ